MGFESKIIRVCLSCIVLIAFIVVIGGLTFGFVRILLSFKHDKVPKPDIDITIPSMEFMVLNITQTHLSAKWNLSIRIPSYLPGNYICLQGDLETSVLYKNSTLVTSTQKYNNLEWYSAQVLRISTNVSEKDISGLIGNVIMKDIKERKEVKFGTRLFLTDCRKGTTGMMRYACDEITLHFEPGSDMNATMVGNNSTCINV